MHFMPHKGALRTVLAFWIRLHRLGVVMGRRRARQVVDAIRRAQQERADREVLARLDARTLKDIGLESYIGRPDLGPVFGIR